ncbi:prepilin peptidase [Candidatus Daviesbacteria bacterium]|nr:prepilin peptidase [Candidatus Daviesbacteria bacterium]
MFSIWFGLIVGAVLGSFIKAIADRSLQNRSFFGRSNCQRCNKNIAWYDLFPIISFLILRGKCRNCGKNIGKEYVLVEVVSAVIFAFFFFQIFKTFPGTENLLKLTLFLADLATKTFFITILLILTITDLKKMLIPDRVILPSLLILGALLVLFTGYKIWYLYYSLSQNPIGLYLLPPHSDYFIRHVLAIIDPLKWSFLMLVLISGFFITLILITKGKGMGGGDVKLGAFMGLGLGFPGALVGIMVAFFSGAIISLFLIAFRKKSFGESVPFGPFLVLGSVIALFWQTAIINWYLNLSF